MGVIPTIAPFLLPVMLPRLRQQWPNLKLYLREETSSAACDRCTVASSIACCSPFPSAAATSTMRCCSKTPCSSPFRAARRRRRGRSRRPHRRESAAAARGWPLPQGPRAVGLQPARASGPCRDDGHLAAHAGADGRQRPRSDVRPGDGDRGRNPTGTEVEARALRSEHPYRRIALIWRRSSPREASFSCSRRSTLRKDLVRLRNPVGSAASGGAGGRGNGDRGRLTSGAGRSGRRSSPWSMR